MFLAQRLEKIKEIVSAYKSIDITTLSNMLDVSDVTVRKDLERLETDGFLTKIHGGAMLNEKTELQLPSQDLVTIPGYSRKKSIAKAALQLIKEEDRIFIGAGTTCLILADELSSRTGLSIITNNFNAMQLMQSSQNKTIMLGGELYKTDNSSFLFGASTENQLKEIYVNKAFISVDAVDLKGGLTMESSVLLNILRATREIAEQLILIVDSSKFNKRELHRLGEFELADCIITNTDSPADLKETAFQKNIKFITALEI